MPYTPTGGGMAELPVGTILDWPVVGAEGKWPDAGEWKECDGAAVSKTAYADLWTLFGSHIWGSDPGSGNFLLPDFRRRVLVGRSTSGSPSMALGATCGCETHTLQATEMPAHTHTVSGSWATGLSKSCCNACTTSGAVSMLCAATNVTTSSISPANTGGGGAHNNLQPYAAVCKLIKVKKAA